MPTNNFYGVCEVWIGIIFLKKGKSKSSTKSMGLYLYTDQCKWFFLCKMSSVAIEGLEKIVVCLLDLKFLAIQ